MATSPTLAEVLIELRRRRAAQLKSAMSGSPYGPTAGSGLSSMLTGGTGPSSSNGASIGSQLGWDVFRGAVQSAQQAALPQAANLTFGTGTGPSILGSQALPAAQGGMAAQAAGAASGATAAAKSGIGSLLAMIL